MNLGDGEPDEPDDRECARRWLVAQGAWQDADGVWSDPDVLGRRPDQRVFAQAWAGIAMETPELGDAGAIRVVLGLMDLFGEPSLTGEFAVFVDAYDETRERLWEAYRPRLEAVGEPVGVVDSLRYWFLDGFHAGDAFHGVLGRDVPGLVERLRPGAPGRDPLLRRARRVLAVSGPVPWEAKRAAYEAAAAVPDLRDVLESDPAAAGPRRRPV
ncbi:hypothetical protein GCM10010420_39840 [Streptomyces glaucosporus]|uniref:Uncharacterized protein n=1 Tax=Streptomyces glaucosporus TaxID=284044 RepID=A0ABP5VNI6_9ACTN